MKSLSNNIRALNLKYVLPVKLDTPPIILFRGEENQRWTVVRRIREIDGASVFSFFIYF